MRVGTHIHFDLELLDDGWQIGAEIEATGDLSGSHMPAEPDVGFTGGWEDLEITNVEISVAKRLTSGQGWEDKAIKMPEALQPYLEKWVEASHEWLAEKLEMERVFGDEDA